MLHKVYKKKKQAIIKKNKKKNPKTIQDAKLSPSVAPYPGDQFQDSKHRHYTFDYIFNLAF